MALVPGWPVATQRSPAECSWCGCGRLVELDVLVTVAGEPSGLTVWVGGYCVGHAVITGVEAQARHGGELWYSALLGPLRGANEGAASLN
jgi:hypothetical protein